MGVGKTKRTRRRSGKTEDVPMTPMIDIVFQLLVRQDGHLRRSAAGDV